MSTPKETKSPPSATVFGHMPTKLTVKILRSILTSYGDNLKAQELRRDLLERVVSLENKVSEQDRRTISQLLEAKVAVTHAAIIAGREYDEPANVADDDNEVNEEQSHTDEYERRHDQRWRPSYNHWREHGTLAPDDVADDEEEDEEQMHTDEHERRYDRRWPPYNHQQEHRPQPPPLSVKGKGKEVMRSPPSMTEEKSDEGKGQLCSLCHDEKPSHDFREANLHPNCGVSKGVHMCEACVKKWINKALSYVRWENISCPFDNRQLPADIVRQYLEPAMVAKYNTFWKLLPIRGEPNFRWCASPKCDWGQIHDSEELEPQITCTRCSYMTCFTHQLPWHEGQTCKEFNVQLDPGQKQQIAASEQNLKQTSAPCPKCSTPITKLGGCSAVTCVCGHSFNWKAAMDSRSGTTLHSSSSSSSR